ncbi:MAG: hypothetical protein ACOVQE_11485 [Chitinophagaceae bacterium]
MKQPIFNTEALTRLSKLVTPLNCRIVIYDERGITFTNELPKNTVIVNEKNKGAFFFRDAETPFLLAINLNNYPVNDPGFDALIALTLQANDYKQYQYNYLQAEINTDGSIDYLFETSINAHYQQLLAELYLNKNNGQLGFWQQFFTGNQHKQTFHIYSRKKPFYLSFSQTNNYLITYKNAPCFECWNLFTIEEKETIVYQIPLNDVAQRSNLNEWITVDTIKATATIPAKLLPEVVMIDKAAAVTRKKWIPLTHFGYDELPKNSLQNLCKTYFLPYFFKSEKANNSSLVLGYERRLHKWLQNAEHQNNKEIALAKELLQLADLLKKQKAPLHISFAFGSSRKTDWIINDDEIVVVNLTHFNRSAPLFFDLFNCLFYQSIQSNLPNLDFANDFVEKSFSLIMQLNASEIAKQAIQLPIQLHFFILCAGLQFLEHHNQESNQPIHFWRMIAEYCLNEQVTPA